MCGICGYLGQGGPEILKRMAGTLKHRGPDDEGFYLDQNLPGQQASLGLGHRRLSIIDLSTAGRQPMTNEDKTIWLVFNGEVYNFQGLRDGLIKRGHRFISQTDSETIIHLYEEKGEEFLRDLNGMFALALWDKPRQKLILARDRLGKKPLYYSLANQTLIFASEIKALLEHPLIKKDLDLECLAKYLIYEYVPAPNSIFKGIHKLGPGEYLVYQGGRMEIKKYWEISFKSKIKSLPRAKSRGQKSKPQLKIENLDYYLKQFDEQLERAVKMRLVSDVPLGVFLSGGIDSTAIAYYSQKNSSEKIKTFSIGFTEKSFDESNYARQAARFLNTEHYEKILTPKDFLELIPRITDFLDEPLADGSIVPTYLLCQFTRQKVTVALSGDGGDELLMGYPTFQAHQLARLYQLIPAALREKIINPLVGRLPVSFDNFSFDFKLKKFISGFALPAGRQEHPAEIRDQLWLGSFSPEDFKNLFAPEAYQLISANNHFAEIENYLKIVKDEPFYNRLIYLYLKNYLQEDILVKTDRASMAVSLEARAPFLDYHLVEFINSLPHNLKMRGWKTKYLLKEAMKDKLPREIVFRPKKGFGMPIAHWLRQELKDFVLSLFEERKIKQEGIFNYSYIKQLLDEHFSGRKDNRKQLWTLMVFEMWRERWLK